VLDKNCHNSLFCRYLLGLYITVLQTHCSQLKLKQVYVQDSTCRVVSKVFHINDSAVQGNPCTSTSILVVLEAGLQCPVFKINIFI